MINDTDVRAVIGKIGAGKSKATSILQSKGYHIISLDEIATDLYEHPMIQNKLYFEFNIKTKEEMKTYIENYASSFNSFSDILQRLEGIMIPYIWVEMMKQIKPGETNIVEGIITVYPIFQKVITKYIVVIADEVKRIQNLANTRMLNAQLIVSYNDYQEHQLEEFASYDVDLINIYNDFNIDDFEKQLEREGVL